MASKLFVSLPMAGMDPDDIRNEMNWARDIISNQLEEDFEIIDTVFEDDIPETVKYDSYYLGRSIQAMAEADLVLFHPAWRNARGCIIEHMICSLYMIPYTELVQIENGSIEELDTDNPPDDISDSSQKLSLV